MDDIKKILVTGATSMIGVSVIAAALCDDSIEKIYAVVKPGSIKTERICKSERIKILYCDCMHYDRLPELVDDKIDVFYHLAWPRTPTYKESIEELIDKSYQLGGVIRAVEVASRLGARKFIGAGTQAEYGIKNEVLKPSTSCNPVRADGILKLAAGQLAMEVSRSFGIICIWMRIFSIYGRYDRKDSMIMTTVAKLLRNEYCQFTPSEQIWDYLYEDDAGRAFWLAAKEINKSRVFCLASGTSMPLREYINVIRNVVAPNAKIGIGELPYPVNPVMQLRADISDLQRETGWTPQITFEEGIKNVCEYLQRGGNRDIVKESSE